MKPRVRQVDHVPHIRRQRSTTIDTVWPQDATGYHHQPTPDKPGRYTPGQLGRFPTIGLDHGHIPGTRPDHQEFRE